MTQRTADEVRAELCKLLDQIDAMHPGPEMQEIERLRAELAAIERTQDERAG